MVQVVHMMYLRMSQSVNAIIIVVTQCCYIKTPISDITPFYDKLTNCEI